MGVLAGGVAHDFNNLLQGIIGNVDLAMMDVAESSPAMESLKRIEEAARKASMLTRQMMAYSGQSKLNIQPLNLSTLITEISQLLSASVTKKVNLEFHLKDDLPLIKADVSQIRQLLLNLVTNASEAVGDHSGNVRISTDVMSCDREFFKGTVLDEGQEVGDYVFVEVSDDGPGMDAETVKRIFDPFYSTKFIGRGLGLAAVLGIVRGHNGAIKVKTEVGSGCVFKALFPVAIESTAEGAAERKPAVVMLVDDEETVRNVTGRMLERMNMEVLFARDGREAVEVFKRNVDRIQLVLLDLTMPYMGGEETLHEIRKIRADMPVIFASGIYVEDTEREYGDLDLAGFIQKPYKMADLRQKIEATLGGH
jgi:CheY-like chemotaxis protein